MSNNQTSRRDLPENRSRQEIDTGERYHNVFIGGGFQLTGLMMREDKDIRGRSDQVKTAFVDTDPNYLEALPQEDKFMLDDVRAAALLESIEKHPDRFVGWEMLGDLEQKWRALGAAESLPAGLMSRRELGPLVLSDALWRKLTDLRNFLMHSARELHRVDPETCRKVTTHLVKKLSLGNLILSQQLWRHRLQPEHYC